jgi:hypothetical protein
MGGVGTREIRYRGAIDGRRREQEIRHRGTIDGRRRGPRN